MNNDFLYSEFFSSLFHGRILFLIICTVLSGYFVGWRHFGWIGNIVWIAILVFLQSMIFVSSDYSDALIRIMETGIGDGIAGSIVKLHMVFHPVVLVLSIILGRSVRKDDAKEQTDTVDAMSAEKMTSILDIVSNHPELAAAGWFANRWIKMTADEQLGWTEKNLIPLRQLWLNGGWDGFDAYGMELPVHLAIIDKGEVK